MTDLYNTLLELGIPITVDFFKHELRSNKDIIFSNGEIHLEGLDRLPLIDNYGEPIDHIISLYNIYTSIVPPKRVHKLAFPVGDDSTFGPEYEDIPFYYARLMLELAVFFYIEKGTIQWKGDKYFWKITKSLILRKEWFKVNTNANTTFDVIATLDEYAERASYADLKMYDGAAVALMYDAVEQLGKKYNRKPTYEECIEYIKTIMP